MKSEYLLIFVRVYQRPQGRLARQTQRRPNGCSTRDQRRKRWTRVEPSFAEQSVHPETPITVIQNLLWFVDPDLFSVHAWRRQVCDCGLEVMVHWRADIWILAV